MNQTFAEIIREMCPLITRDVISGAFLDNTTKSEFDNAYYKNLQSGQGLLASDQALYIDRRTRDRVNMFASNQTAFFEAFTTAIIKLGRVGVKTASDGEIRKDCRFPN
jgi:peroxidase